MGLLGGDIEVVEVQRHRIGPALPNPDIEHPGRSPVIALLDGSHPTRPHHADQAGLVEDFDVIGNGALGPAHGARELGHGGGPLVEQTQDRRSELIADGLHLAGIGEFERVDQFVIGHDRLDGP